MTTDAKGIHMGDGRPNNYTMKMHPSGRYVDPFKATVDDIEIGDIGHHLSNVIRYGGGMATPESVAEHSVYVTRLVARETADPEVLLAAVLHDAPEAYFGDTVRPLKHLKAFKAKADAEAALARVIAARFDLDPALFEHPVLLEVDREICRWEMATMRDLVRPPLGFRRARDMYLAEFQRVVRLRSPAP